MTTNKDNTNLEFSKGRTEVHQFVLTNSDGDPYDLTGFVLRCQARHFYDSESTLFDISIVDGENNNSFSSGIIYLVVSSTISNSLPPQCVYDILAVSGDIKIPLAKGRINTQAGVTRGV